MSKTSRLALIRELENHRGRRLLAFVLGDRQGLETRIAGDSISLTAQLLEQIGKVPELDIFVYSTGGITMAAYALVNLVREYASKFSVLVPYKAQSAATLICLGADEIVMTPLATLSPGRSKHEHAVQPASAQLAARHVSTPDAPGQR